MIWSFAALLLAVAGTGQGQVDHPLVLTHPKQLEPWALSLNRAMAERDGVKARQLIADQLRLNPDPPNRQYLLLTRASLGLLEGNEPAARRDFADAASTGDPIAVAKKQFEIGSQLSPALAAEAIDQLAIADPSGLRGLDVTAMRRVLHRLHQTGMTKRYDDLVIVLAKVGYGDAASSEDIATTGARLLIERGDAAEAIPILKRVSQRATLVDLATQRGFEAVWPEIEKEISFRMRAPDRNVQLARREFEAAPHDFDKRLALMLALEDQGELEEAAKLGSIATTAEELARLDERAIWLIDAHARMLTALGREGEADQSYESLLQSWSDDRPWLVNIAINRIQALVDDGEFAKAEQVRSLYAPRIEAQGNDFARQLMRRNRICAAAGLNNRAEAETLLPDLEAHADDAPAATIDALLCAKQVDRAEAQALRMIKGSETRPAIVAMLRADGEDRQDWLSVLWRTLRARPGVDRAFRAVARDIPKALWDT